MSDATDDHARAIAAARIDELRTDIREHNRRYYEEDEPSIPDSEWDALMVELRSLEAEYPELDSPESPSHSVGGAPTVQFAEVVHSLPMMSLDNAFAFAELDSWAQRATRGLGADQTLGPLVCELKFDGLAISVRYEKGRLVRAATRGNGRVGEDVTANVRTIADVPHRLAKGAPAVLEVRGEVYMSLAVFAALNEALSKAGERTYVNPRNTAASDPSATGWHTGPARQFVITLSGNSEVEVSGGVHVVAGPGHINLIEDTTGKGHITRNFGPDDRIALTIPLADGVVIQGVKKPRTR